MGPCLFLIEHFFCLFHHKTRWTMLVDNVGLKICMLGTLDSVVTLTFFVGVNRSDPRRSSTTNHKFFRAMGQLHGPWCKQPLRGHEIKGQFTWDPKSQVPTFEPQETIKTWLLINTIPKLYLQKVFPRRHPCHTWDSWLGTWCRVVSPHSMLSVVEITHIDLKWLGTLCEPTLSLTIDFSIVEIILEGKVTHERTPRSLPPIEVQKTSMFELDFIGEGEGAKI